MSNITTVAAWGTFDGTLHPGHLYFLAICKQYGDVTVFLLDDAGIRRQKSREPIFPQAVRRKNLLASGLVAHVIEGGPDQEKNIQATIALRPDVYCFGDDQFSSWNAKLERALKDRGVKIVRVSSYKRKHYSTTAIYFGGGKTPKRQ